MRQLSLMVKPVSGSCNLRCGYCFYVDEMANRAEGARGRMDAGMAERVLRRALAYAEGGLSLVFQGGEPTLAGAEFYRDWLKMERRLNTRGLPVRHALQTNGYVLDEEMLAVLKAGDFLVGVSVDGTKEIHDSRRRAADGGPSFDRVWENLARLRKAGIPYNVLCVVDDAVAARGSEVYGALRGQGYVQFIPCLPGLDAGEAPLDARKYGEFLVAVYDGYARDLRAGRYVSVNVFDNWVRMLNGYPPASCGLSGSCAPNLVVEADGRVYPCDFYCLDEWLLGNIAEESLFSMMAGERERAFLESSLKADEGCLACEWLALCRGGCRRDRQAGRADTPGKNRLCEGFQYFFERRMADLRALAMVPVNSLPRQG